MITFKIAFFGLRRSCTFVYNTDVLLGCKRYISMDLKQVVEQLKFFAPLTLAADWDNVGLLVEPSAPHTVKKLLLCNDLTEEVMLEAVGIHTNMILTYHPLIFSSIKQLTQKEWKERVITKCLENRIAVFSPHTSYDAQANCLTDWLISPFDGKVSPITVSKGPAANHYRLEFILPLGIEQEIKEQLDSLLPVIPGVTINSTTRLDSGGSRVGLSCNNFALNNVVDFLNQFSAVKSTMEIFKTEKVPLPGCGDGRLCQLVCPISLKEAVDRIKTHLKITYVRVALPATGMKTIHSIAVCAGSGASVLQGCPADLYITGEMSHHGLLDAIHAGHMVILCEHSNTERGYLKELKPQLQDLLTGVDIVISQRDRDPLDLM